MKNVIIWGSGMYYRYKADYLRKNFHVLGVIGKESDGEEIDGHPMIKKEELKYRDYDNIIVMSDVYMFDIVQEILLLGIRADKIMFGVNLPPATGRDALYISKEEQLSIKEDGTIVWNHDVVVSCWEDIEKLKVLHIGTMTEETIRNMPVKPLSYNYGMSRGEGHSIARYYIEQFVTECKEFIKGTVMEIGDGRYSTLGQDAVEELLILSLDDEEKEHYIKGNLETGEGLQEESVDCLILTNVLSSLFDVQAAVCNIGKILKGGGYAIITVPGIASLYRVQYETYGQFWRYTPSGIVQLLERYIPGAKLSVKEYGNVKTSAAFLYGLTVEDLTTEELEYRDSCYPLLIGICLEK